jgi:hypothetical protein
MRECAPRPARTGPLGSNVRRRSGETSNRHIRRGVGAHISRPLQSPPRSPSRTLAVVESLTPLRYPMPYPISQAHTAQPQKRSQKMAIALLMRTGCAVSRVSAVCGFRGKS